MAKVIGVDSSTQSCKVVVRDADTGVLLSSGRATHPDGTEVDPRHWWDALQAALSQAGGLDGVGAVSIAGQQHGMVVLDADGRLGAVNWTFNGWGAQDWASWEADAEAGGAATTATTAVRIDSQLVNEGGGIHTDGAGTFLVTTTVQLDPGRNPGWTAPGVEAELARTVGATKVIWLPRGLTRDSETYGTRGHVDLLAAFSAPGRVLVHDQRDPSHPDHAISRDLIARLSAETDASGRALEVTALPAPATLRDRDGYVDYSYVNHYVLNGAVVAGVFDDPNDAAALAVLADAYPGREVVAVDARPLFARGGGVHCITQQQPRSRVEEKP